jgi:hypothetical protein
MGSQTLSKWERGNMRQVSFSLRRELGVALGVKFVLLLGLWFLLFRWQDRPVEKPETADLFAPVTVAAQVSSVIKH